MKLVLALLFLALGATSANATSEQHTDQADASRIGGSYTVERVTSLDDGTFQIVFKATVESGRFDQLVLHSDHVHVAVKAGQEIRLSAEILSEKGSTAEVAQMVLFLPSRVGRVPVWLLSTKSAHTSLKGAKYLEMHVPVNDFFIM